MASNRRRAVLTVVLVAMVGLFAGEAWVQHRTNAEWQRVAAERDGLAVQLAARPTQRAPLLGAPTPGLAFDHYAVAATAAAPLDRDRSTEAHKLLTADDATVAAAPLRAAWDPVVAAVRAGAQADDARAPQQGPMTKSGDGIVDLLAVRWVANAAAFEARARLHEGRGDDAVRVSLAGMTLGRDVLHSGLLINQLIGCAVLAIGVDTWTEARLARLSPEARELLATGLAALDAQLPVALDFTAELGFAAAAIAQLEAAGGKDQGSSALGAWRHGFSPRWQLASHFLGYADVVRLADATRNQPWPERKARLRAAIAEADAAGNAFVAVAHLDSAERQLRSAVASVRLLRMALDLHAGRDASALPDPLAAAPIAVSAGEGGVRLASADAAKQPRLQRLVVR
ncbi:MAG: hypothetical protein FJ306_00085 [Planctomycetes bacterium]|nr:hypothetical protein [Planctomycetota bacterium]